MSAQPHQSDTRILDRRTLWHDHRCLPPLLSPGLSVLDVGCGTGAITRGIAEAVGPTGLVVGVDRDAGLIERARAHAGAVPHLRFEEGDATRLDYDARFDVVTAARALQWIASPEAALTSMTRAVRPGGRVVVLDYNHTLNSWEPAPPPDFLEVYALFLSWRAANGWDNEMANHCPALFEAAGLLDIRTELQDETSGRGDERFEEKSSLWTGVLDNIGPSLVKAHLCEASLLDAARGAYEGWRTTTLMRLTLSMKTTVGTVPARTGRGQQAGSAG